MSATTQDMLTVVSVLEAFAETIRKAKSTPLGGIPSGELYTLVMGKMSIHTYSCVIGILKHAKLVQETNHLLTWIGPEIV